MLDSENTEGRNAASNPSIRLDFHAPRRGFAPTNGLPWPPSLYPQISQQSEQVIPRTDIPLPPTGSYATTPCAEQSRHAFGLRIERVTSLCSSHVFDLCDACWRGGQLGRTLPRLAFGPALFA